MVKITLGVCILAAVLLLTGCNHNKCKECIPTTVVKIQEVNKPIYVCPQELQTLQYPQRPSLLIDQLSEQDINDPGRVVQYYKATVKQLINYSKDLESVTNIQQKSCEGLPSVIVPSRGP